MRNTKQELRGACGGLKGPQKCIRNLGTTRYGHCNDEDCNDEGKDNENGSDDDDDGDDSKTQIAGDKCTGNEVAIGDGKAATGSETKYGILKRECMKKHSQKYKTKMKSNYLLQN